MFFKDKVHISEVIKWGVIAGFFEGVYIFVAAIIYAKQQTFTSLVGGWEYPAGVFLLLLIALSAVVTTIIVFAHPIHSLLRKHYKDALLTVLVSVATIFVMVLLLYLLYPLFI